MHCLRHNLAQPIAIFCLVFILFCVNKIGKLDNSKQDVDDNNKQNLAVLNRILELKTKGLITLLGL